MGNLEKAGALWGDGPCDPKPWNCALDEYLEPIKLGGGDAFPVRGPKPVIESKGTAAKWGTQIYHILADHSTCGGKNEGLKRNSSKIVPLLIIILKCHVGKAVQCMLSGKV